MIVGAGGTGGFLAEAVCRLLTGRNDTIILVDHDIVEPHNLLRQNFTRGDLGKLKSRALAERLSHQFDRPVGYIPEPFRAEHAAFKFRRGLSDDSGRNGRPDLIIGCVDNADARREIGATLDDRTPAVPWIMDTGNGRNWGQILICNTPAGRSFGDAFAPGVCYRLPAPTVQRPDLLTFVPEEPPDTDCAAAMDLTDQDPTINQMMAASAAQVVRRMLAGTCPFMALYIEMEVGSIQPTYATPDNVNRICGADGIQHPDP